MAWRPPARIDGEPTVPRLLAVTVISPLDSLLHRLGLPGAAPPTPPEPAFTVIVRTQGRRPRTLREAMASLAAQSRPPDFDAVVVAHGPEGTAATAESALAEAAEAEAGSMPARWSVIAAVGGGRCRPLNAGLDAAAGDYVAFLDDDDLAGPDWLAAFARGAAEAPGRIIRAACGVQTWAAAGTAEPQAPLGPVEHPYAGEFDLLAHLSHSETPICSVALPRPGLERFGLRFDEDLQVCEDWDMIVRAALLIGVHSIPESTSLYRRADGANSRSEADEAQWRRDREKVIRKLESEAFVLDGPAARRLAEAHFTSGGGPEAMVEAIPTRTLLAALPKRLRARLALTLRRPGAGDDPGAGSGSGAGDDPEAGDDPAGGTARGPR